MGYWKALSRKSKCLLIGSPVFLITLWYLMMNQGRMITGIITAPFNLSLMHLLKFFMTDNWLSVLIQDLKNISIQLGVVIGSQLLFFVIGIMILLVLQWKNAKEASWYIGNKFIFGGYLFLLLSTISLAVVLGNETYQLAGVINHSLERLSPAELRILSDSVAETYHQFTWSIDSIFKDATGFMSTMNSLIASTKEIATIPDLIIDWFNHLAIYRNYLLGFVGFSTITIVSGHLMEFYRVSKLNKPLSRKNKKVSIDERIITLLEQQQKLLEKMNEK